MHTQHHWHRCMHLSDKERDNMKKIIPFHSCHIQYFLIFSVIMLKCKNGSMGIDVHFVTKWNIQMQFVSVVMTYKCDKNEKNKVKNLCAFFNANSHITHNSIGLILRITNFHYSPHCIPSIYTRYCNCVRLRIHQMQAHGSIECGCFQ